MTNANFPAVNYLSLQKLFKSQFYTRPLRKEISKRHILYLFYAGTQFKSHTEARHTHTHIHSAKCLHRMYLRENQCLLVFTLFIAIHYKL